MAPTVESMTEADFPRGFEILSEAFAHDHEYIETVFPKHETASGRKIGGERLLSIDKAQTYAHFLKALDAKGEIIAMAKWNLFRNEIPPEDGIGTQEFWDDKATAEYADSIYRHYLTKRRKAIRESGGNLASLDLLVVDPKHFRKGAGRALIRWGLAWADKMGVEAVVEASTVGVPAYEAEGFRNLGEVTVEIPDAPEFAHRPRQKFYWMVRPKLSAP